MKPLPDPLLRSVIRFGQEDEASLSSNLFQLRQEIQPVGIDSDILSFISDLFDKTHAVSPVDVIFSHFSDLSARGDGKGIAGTTRLEMVRDGNHPLLEGATFRYSLDQFKHVLATEQLSNVLIEASAILTSGVRRKEGTVQGPEATLDYLHSSVSQLSSILRRGSIEGSFRTDANTMRRLYQMWKDSPRDTVGVMTGIERIDVAHRGIRKGELSLVMGFVSHLKTSFCLNWLYRAAMIFGMNAAIASLETAIEDLRTILYVMHSAHPKFLELGFQPLDYVQVTTGSLSPEEENVWDRVIDDFENCSDYGEIFYKEPDEALTIGDIKRWAEDKHKHAPLELLVIDYLGLVDPDLGQSSLDSGANLNKVIRASKQLAMTFAKGDKIAVVSPHQANREGLKEAEKNGGRYKLTALANSNEAERSTDLIYYTYMDDMLRNSNELLLGNLKARKRIVLAEPFKTFADPRTWVVSNLEEATATPDQLVTL